MDEMMKEFRKKYRKFLDENPGLYNELIQAVGREILLIEKYRSKINKVS